MIYPHMHMMSCEGWEKIADSGQRHPKYPWIQWISDWEWGKA